MRYLLYQPVPARLTIDVVTSDHVVTPHKLNWPQANGSSLYMLHAINSQRGGGFVEPR